MHIAPASALIEMSKRNEEHRSRRDASWYRYEEGDLGGAIPFAVSKLYRGQNAHHTPMLPSIGRGLQSTDIEKISQGSIADQAKIILRVAQAWWFSRELTHHPISHHAAGQHLDLDPIALAQHYGIPTGYLDLSDDFNVSAFFATCHETKDGIVSERLSALRNEISTLANLVDYRRLLTEQRIAPLLADPKWVEQMLGVVTAKAIAVSRVRIPPTDAAPEADSTT